MTARRSSISLTREARRRGGTEEYSVMPSRRSLSLAAAIMASAVAGCMAVSVALAPTPVTLATGTPGGVYHPVGNAICRMFNLVGEHQAMPCVAVSSDGSVANIRRIESGDSTFGLVADRCRLCRLSWRGTVCRRRPRSEAAHADRALPGSLYRCRAGRNRHTQFPGFARQAHRHRQERRRLYLHARRRPRVLRLDDIGSRPGAGARARRTEPGALRQQGRRDHFCRRAIPMG